MSKYINKQEFYLEMKKSHDNYKNLIYNLDDHDDVQLLRVINKINLETLPFYVLHKKGYNSTHDNLIVTLTANWLYNQLDELYEDEETEITIDEYISTKHYLTIKLFDTDSLKDIDYSEPTNHFKQIHRRSQHAFIDIISKGIDDESTKLKILTKHNCHIFSTKTGLEYKRNYNKNKLLKVLDRQLKNKALTPKSIQFFQKLVKQTLRKLPYTDAQDREECESGALLDLLYYWTGFDFERKKDPFSYYTSIVFMGAAKEFKRLKMDKNKFKISLDQSSSSSSSSDDSSIYSI